MEQLFETLESSSLMPKTMDTIADILITVANNDRNNKEKKLFQRALKEDFN